MSRAVTATIAGAVMLGTMAGTSAAGTPSIPSVQVIGGNPSEETARLAGMVADLAANCLAADDSLCAAAERTALDAVDVASACLDAMASEAGIAPAVTVAMTAMNLDCGGIVRLMEGYARFALQQVSDCTTEQVSTCAVVFEAARLGIDRAAGCLMAVLPPSALALSGTDPGCASAIGMLYREAEGVIAVLTACLNGTDMACTLARDYAQFAVDNLAGCTGDLFRFYTKVDTFGSGDTLDCYAVLDQVNVAINSLLGQVPALPTQITPTGDEDCSITVEIPIVAVDPTNPDASQQIESPHDAHAFVPACYEPEWMQQQLDAETPPLATGLEGPECENATPREEHFIDRTTGDAKKNLGHDLWVNYNGAAMQGELTVSVDTTYHAKITAGGETQLKTWIGKIKVHVEAEAGISRTVTKSVTIKPNVPPKTEYHLARKLFAKVVEGRYYQKFSDCRVKWSAHRIKSPYYDAWFKWEEPYNGPKPE